MPLISLYYYNVFYILHMSSALHPNKREFRSQKKVGVICFMSQLPGIYIPAIIIPSKIKNNCYCGVDYRPITYIQQICLFILTRELMESNKQY